MTRAKLFKHTLTIGGVAGVGGDKYSFRAPDIYGDFGGVTGVTKAADNDTTDYKGRLTSEDFATGKCIRLKCRASTTDLVGNKKYRDFVVVSSFDKTTNAIANLDEKKITVGGIAGVGSTTWDILTTRIPRRRRFS